MFTSTSFNYELLEYTKLELEKLVELVKLVDTLKGLRIILTDIAKSLSKQKYLEHTLSQHVNHSESERRNKYLKGLSNCREDDD